MSAPILEGERVVLGPHRRELAPLLARWMNDPLVTRTLNPPLRVSTLEAHERWLERRRDSFLIRERATGRPIGSCGLLDVASGSAELAIVIGERSAWNRGCGTEAVSLLLGHAFRDLALPSVFLQTDDFHAGALRAYSRAGFREIGRLRQASRLGQRPNDVVLMDATSEEYRPWTRS